MGSVSAGNFTEPRLTSGDFDFLVQTSELASGPKEAPEPFPYLLMG
jgi:hypothetical protein